VVRARLQVSHERIAIGAEVNVGVDEHRHHGLAGEIHPRDAGGQADGCRRAGLGNLRPFYDQRAFVDHAAVAHDEARAFVRGRGLPGRRRRATGKEAQGNDCCDGDIELAHRISSAPFTCKLTQW